MKRLPAILTIALALFISAASAAPVAHAQFRDSFGNPYDTREAANAADAAQQAASTEANVQGGLNANGTLTPEQYSAANKAAAETPTPYSPGDKFETTTNGIMAWIASLFAWLVTVAMIVLNYAVHYTVVTMGDYVNKLSAVGVTWRIMRDFGNIALIFGFLAAGIMTILNAEYFGWGKNMLPRLLIAAVLLNFSLFFAEAIVDTGNLFATQFYAQINGGTLPTGAMLNSEGVSGKIMQQLGLQSIYNVTPSEQAALYKNNPMFVGFMSIILFIVLAFVLFSLAFILIARFVILLFLIIVAPIGFAGLAIPKLAGRAKQWWDTLLEQTITAPVLLLLLYVALAVITDEKFLSLGGGKPPNWLGLFGNSADIGGYASALISFLVAMGLLLAVVIASKKLSAFGGEWATGAAGKLSFGVTAWAGRSSAGWLSARAAEGWRRSRWSRAPVLGRAVSGTLERGAKASFDVRGIKHFGGLKAVGVDAGTAQKGGYREWEKERIKQREEYAKTLEQTTGKFLGIPYMRGGGEKGQQKLAEDRKAEAQMAVLELQQDQQRAMEALRAQGATNAQINALRDNQRQELEVARAKVEAYQEEADRTARKPQEGYARGITWGPGSWFRRNKVAAENIKKNARKSRSDRDIDALKGLLERSASSSGAGAGGGGAGGTPPAGGGGGATP